MRLFVKARHILAGRWSSRLHMAPREEGRGREGESFWVNIDWGKWVEAYIVMVRVILRLRTKRSSFLKMSINKMLDIREIKQSLTNVLNSLPVSTRLLYRRLVPEIQSLASLGSLKVLFVLLWVCFRTSKLRSHTPSIFFQRSHWSSLSKWHNKIQSSSH